MRPTKTEAGMALLGGALLGAAAMYLMDPEHGRRRRQYLSDQAGEKLHGAGDLATAAWEQARQLGASLGDLSGQASDRAGDAMSDARESAADHARRVRDQAAQIAESLSSGTSSAGRWLGGGLSGLSGALHGIGDLTHGLWDRARHFGHRSSEDAQSWASDLADRARHSSHSMRHRLAQAIDPDHVRGTPHVVGWTSASVGILFAGAGLMYLLDPDRGAARRSQVCDQLSGTLSRMGNFFRKSGRDLANRVTGTETQDGNRSSSPRNAQEDSDGERLLQRIRADLGRVLSFPAQVQLMCDANGAVTLYGRVPAAESERLLSAVRSVPGVRQVNNRTETYSSTEVGNPLSGWTQKSQPQTAPQL